MVVPRAMDMTVWKFPLRPQGSELLLLYKIVNWIWWTQLQLVNIQFFFRMRVVKSQRNAWVRHLSSIWDTIQHLCICQSDNCFLGQRQNVLSSKTRGEKNQIVTLAVKKIQSQLFIQFFDYSLSSFTSYPSAAIMYHISQNKRIVMVQRPNLDDPSLIERIMMVKGIKVLIVDSLFLADEIKHAYL